MKAHQSGGVIELKLSGVVRVLKEEGLGEAWVRLKQKMMVTSDIYEIDLNTLDEKKVEGEKTEYSITPMSALLYHQMVEENGSEIPPEKIKILWERLDGNSTDRVYLLLDQDGTIFGYYCVSYGDNVDVETNYVLKAAKGNAFLFDAYTFIPHRKKGAQKHATIEILRMLQQEGFETATVMIDKTNLYSQKATLKYGFYKTGEVMHINLRFWKKNIERKFDRNDR